TILAASPATIAPGGVARIGISFRPLAAGSRTAWLRISNDDADESVYDISLSGIGVAVPEIAIAPAGAADLRNGSAFIPFPNVELLTTPSRRTLTLRNDGTADLSGIRAWIGGSHAADFSITPPSSGTLAPGASTNIEVSFMPSVSGPRTASLHIVSNDADESEFVIDLNGNGVALPQIEISLATVPAGLARTSHSHSFGSFELRTLSPEVTYVVRNRGSADLADLSLQLTGNHLADFNLRKFAITRLAPGASATFSAAFQPKTVGNRSAAIRITSNDPDNSIIDIPIAGTAFAKPEITVLAEDITLPTGGGRFDFGKMDVNSPLLSRSITIVNSGSAPLERLGLASGALNSAAFLTGSLERNSLAPGASMSLAVMFRPSSAGVFNSELRITSNDTDEPVFVIQLSGTGVTKPSLAVSRVSGQAWGPEGETLAFGSATPGSKGASQTILVRNSGNAPLSISSIRITGSHAGDFTPTGPSGITLPPGVSRSLVIQFSPKSAGPRTASLEIRSNDPNQSSYAIPLTGNGIATPKMEIAIGNKTIADSDFVELAASSTRTITIRNRGMAPLTNLTARITEGAGSGFSVVPLRVKSLLPGKSTTLRVSLKIPSGNSPFAYLRITSNDPSQRDFDIVLTASTSAPNLKKSAIIDDFTLTPLPASRPKPEVSIVVVDGLKYRCITIRRAAYPAINASSIEVSTDRVRWFSGKAHTTVMVDRPDLLRVRDNTPITPAAKRFIRLKQP
nr:choice-of-anchor D domain-containing protein [Akkermansiaceae bacterium]